MNNKVTLRPIEKEDLDSLFKWRNDESIFSQLGGGYFPVSKTEMAKWMDNFCKLDKFNTRFIIEYEKVAVGFISLNNIDYKNGSGELGIYIGESSYQGKGIASSALRKLEKFASNHLGLRKIKLLMNHDNISALKLYEKLSYAYVGKYIRERYVGNKWVDVVIMEKFL